MQTNHARFYRFAFAGLSLFVWAILTTLDAAWQVIFRFGTFQKIDAVYPFTFGAIILTFVLAYVFTRSLLSAVTLPFAFIGLYEIVWHFIPGSGPFPSALGVVYIFSWVAVGCSSIQRWRLDAVGTLMIAIEVALFGIWYAAGFRSEFSLLLNIATKVLMALVFLRLLQVGTERATNQPSNRNPELGSYGTEIRALDRIGDSRFSCKTNISFFAIQRIAFDLGHAIKEHIML